jgi:peptidoglycan hydrolase-like protein with peptidoglycan-binding domain
MNPVPPPPPATTNPLVNSNNTVPPTPAPATAGLPNTPNSPTLPSAQGLPQITANELRPSPALDATQVASVQSSLAAGGLYRGPIDGNMSASLRASIKQYQQITGIPQTGEIDAETMARLQRGALSGNVGSTGTTSTVGNRNAAGDPFVNSIPAGTVPSTASGTATFSTPFSLSNPINTSPATGQTATIQP